MMRTTIGAVALGVGLLLVAGAVPVDAHHGFAAEFDDQKPVTVTGTIALFEWRNPHSWVHLDVTGPDDKVVRWRFELTSVNSLYRRGWRKEAVVVGSEVTATGFLARDGSPTGNCRTLTLADGTVFGSGRAPTDADTYE